MDPQLATLTRDRFSSPGVDLRAKAGRRAVPGLRRPRRRPVAEPEPARHHPHFSRDRRRPGGPAAWPRPGRGRGNRGLRGGPRPGSGGCSNGWAWPARASNCCMITRSTTTCSTSCTPTAVTPGRCRCSSASGCWPAHSTSATRCGSPGTGERDGEAFFSRACRDGWEGLVAKRADSPYTGTRSKDWLKFKCGKRPGVRGRRLHRPAALARRVRRPAARLLRLRWRPGLRREGRHRLRQPDACAACTPRSRAWSGTTTRSPAAPGRPPAAVHWVRPQLVVEVGFSEWTADGELRHPRYQGLRDDKKPADVVRERPEPAA